MSFAILVVLDLPTTKTQRTHPAANVEESGLQILRRLGCVFESTGRV